MPRVIYEVVSSEYFAGGRDTMDLDNDMILILTLPEGWKSIGVLDSMNSALNYKEQLIYFYPFVSDHTQLRVKKRELPSFHIIKGEEGIPGGYTPYIDSLISHTHIIGKYLDIKGLTIHPITGEKRYYRVITLPDNKLQFIYRNLREEEVDVFNKIFDNIIICDPKKTPIVKYRSREILNIKREMEDY